MVKRTSILAIGALIICLGSAYFFLFTATGGCFVIRKAVLWFAKAERVDVRQARGSIISKMTLVDITIQAPRGLPKGSIALIKQADIRLARFSKEGLRITVEDGVVFMPQENRFNFSGSLKGSTIELSIKKALCSVAAIPERVKGTSLSKVLVVLEDVDIGFNALPQAQAKIQKAAIELDIRNISAMKIKVINGRLSLPSSGPILFYGEYEGDTLNFNIYSKSVSVDSLAPFFALEKPLYFVKGGLENVDLFFSGTMHEPVIKGTALVGKIDYQSFSLRNTLLTFDIALKTKAAPAQASGTVHIKQGQVIGPGAVSVQLEESRLLFSGDFNKPVFDINGNSTVEKTKIKIALKGTIDKPELKLSSEPPLPQEQLLVMLVTGKKWSGAQTAFSHGIISPDLAMDFIDYFLLGGAGSKMAGKFGITAFSVTLDKETRGVAVKKSVTDKVEVGYGVTQKQSQGNMPETTQKVSGELKVTDALSIGAEKELKQQDTPGNTPEKKTDDKVMIKFRKEF